MDLSTIMTRINAHHYNSCAHYLYDIDLITNNCLEYNPDRDQYDKLLRNRACELRDVAYQLVNNDLDPEFEKVAFIYILLLFSFCSYSFIYLYFSFIHSTT